MQSLSSVQERLDSPGNWLKETTRELECNTSITRDILMVRLEEHRASAEFFYLSLQG